MKRTMALTILGLVTVLGAAAQARVQTVSLVCSKVSGFYPAHVITVESAVTESGSLFQVVDDPNGYRLDFKASEAGEVSMQARRNFGGNYYYSNFNCVRTANAQSASSK